MGGAPSLFDPRGAFLCMRSWEGLLDLENRKYVVSLSFVGAGLSSSFTLEYLSTGGKLQLLSLGPIYLLPQDDTFYVYFTTIKSIF